MNSAFLCNVVSLIDPSGQQDLAADRYLKMSFKTLPSFNILQPAREKKKKEKKPTQKTNTKNQQKTLSDRSSVFSQVLISWQQILRRNDFFSYS